MLYHILGFYGFIILVFDVGVLLLKFNNIFHNEKNPSLNLNEGFRL